MLGFRELALECPACPTQGAAVYHLLSPGQDSPLATVTEEEFPPDALDRPSWFGWILGWRTPTAVIRVIVRTTAGAPVLFLQYLPPIFQEVVRVYNAEGQLVGRCLSYHKQTLRAGFRMDDVQRRPIALVPFLGSNDTTALLIRAGTNQEIGSILRQGDGPTPPRYRVIAFSSAHTERFFLLAATVTLALADRAFRPAT